MNNSWFSQHGDKVLSLLTAACALITTQSGPLGVDAHVIAWITFASGLGTMAHTLYFPNSASPPLPPPSRGTQRGYSTWGYLASVAAAAALCVLVGSLMGCSSLGTTPPENTEQQIAYGYSGVTAALNTLAQATSQGIVSSTEATSANSAILLAKQSLDQANAIVSSDQPKAISILTNATKDLSMVSAYLTCKQQKGASCQL